MIVGERASRITGREIVMPGWVADSAPVTPSPWDDEFEGPLGGRWTTIPGLLGPADCDRSIASCLVLDAVSASGVYRPCPPTPFRMTADVVATRWPLALTASGGGIGFGEATPGKFFYGPLDIADTGYICVAGGYWTDPSTFNSNIGIWTTGGSATNSASRIGGFGLARPYRVRFDVHSQTNIDSYISWGTGGWQQWLSAYNPGFTFSTVLLFASGGAFAYDWVRFRLIA